MQLPVVGLDLVPSGSRCEDTANVSVPTALEDSSGDAIADVEVDLRNLASDVAFISKSNKQTKIEGIWPPAAKRAVVPKTVVALSKLAIGLVGVDALADGADVRRPSRSRHGAVAAAGAEGLITLMNPGLDHSHKKGKSSKHKRGRRFKMHTKRRRHESYSDSESEAAKAS